MKSTHLKKIDKRSTLKEKKEVLWINIYLTDGDGNPSITLQLDRRISMDRIPSIGSNIEIPLSKKIGGGTHCVINNITHLFDDDYEYDTTVIECSEEGDLGYFLKEYKVSSIDEFISQLKDEGWGVYVEHL